MTTASGPLAWKSALEPVAAGPPPRLFGILRLIMNTRVRLLFKGSDERLIEANLSRTTTEKKTI
jgi:hypothetical protein